MIVEIEDEERVIEDVYVDFEDFMSFKATSRTSDFDDLIQNYIEFVDDGLYHHVREVLDVIFTVKEERKLKLHNVNHLKF